MNLQDLPITSLSFELRYDSAFRVYDTAGQIWSEIQEKWPDLKPLETSPNITKFASMGKVELTVALDRCNVSWPGKTIEQKPFIEYCEFLTNIAKETLKVKRLTRVGLRQIFTQRHKDIEKANEAFATMGLLRMPPTPHFGVNGTPKNIDYSIRSEGDALGWYIRIFTQTKKIVLEPSLGEEDIMPINIERHELVLDLDYYTVSSTPAGQFRATEWIEQAIRVARRDSPFFFSA